MKQELHFDGHGINLKEYDEEGQCIYCERIATMQPRFKGHGIGELLRMAMVMRDTLKVASDALDIARSETTTKGCQTIQSAHTLAKAIHQSAASAYTGDRD